MQTRNPADNILLIFDSLVLLGRSLWLGISMPGLSMCWGATKVRLPKFYGMDFRNNRAVRRWRPGGAKWQYFREVSSKFCSTPQRRIFMILDQDTNT
jgi:hypothetical protein